MGQGDKICDEYRQVFYHIPNIGCKPIKVALIKEGEKTWAPLMSTNAEQSAVEILESYGVRLGMEEVSKDLKEVWGWGKQEVRLP